jgi:hypothetical protein
MSNRGAIWSGAITPQIVPPDVTMRAVDTAVMIAEKPAVVTLRRKVPGSNATIALPEQTVRLEVIQNIRGSAEPENMWFDVSKQYVVIVAMKDHPTIPNADIQRADLFFYLGFMWEVVEIIDNIPGRLLANCNIQP